MQKLTTAQYMEGIQSLKNFSEMLRQALNEAMPGVKLERESAYHWRGYQIIKYPGLTDSQYYCQVYMGTTNSLKFFEYYEMSHKPFQAEIDLLAHGFFELETYAEQLQLLVRFIRQAVSEAVAWNESEKRKEIVPERLQ
jgi:hypothetical protein